MSLILALVVHASAQDFGYVAIMQQAREALVAKDYKTAKTLLTAAEAAAPTSASPLGEADLANLWFYRGLIEWRSGDKDKAALDAWRRVLIVAPQFEPDATLLPETDAQDVLYALRGEVRNYDQFPTGVPEDSGDALIFIDGKRLATDDMLTAGRHLVQVRCADGNFAGSWYDYGTAPSDYLVICTGGTYGPKVAVDPKAAKAAEKAKAEADKKAAAEKAAAEKAASEKALAEAKAAEKKAAADKLAADKKAAADKAEAEKKAAAEKAEADKKAAAEKAAAEKAALATTKPDDKAAAEKAAAEKAIAEKAAAEKKAATEKAATEKAEAEKKAAAEKAALATAKPDDKAAAEKAAAEKKAAEKAAAEKAAAEKATANVSGTGSQATITPKAKGADIPAIALMTVGGGLIAGGLAMNYTVVEPAYAAISEANAHPGTMSADVATAWEGRFDVGRYSTIGMIGGGAALLGVGVVLQVIDVPVAVLPNGIVVSGRW